MGSNKSRIEQNISNEINTKAVTNIVTDNVTNSSNLVSLKNNFSIKLGKGAQLDCNDFSLTQTNSGDVKIATQINSQTAANLSSYLKSDLSSENGQANKLLQGFLSGIGQVNNTKLNQNIRNRINDIIEKNITTHNINNILNQTKLLNDGTIELGEGAVIRGNTCKFVQGNVANYASSTILSNLANVVSKDEAVNSLVQKATQTSETQQKGLDDFVSALFGPFIIFLVVGGLIAYAVFKKVGLPKLTSDTTVKTGFSYSDSYSD